MGSYVMLRVHDSAHSFPLLPPVNSDFLFLRKMELEPKVPWELSVESSKQSSKRHLTDENKRSFTNKKV